MVRLVKHSHTSVSLVKSRSCTSTCIIWVRCMSSVRPRCSISNASWLLVLPTIVCVTPTPGGLVNYDYVFRQPGILAPQKTVQHPSRSLFDLEVQLDIHLRSS